MTHARYVDLHGAFISLDLLNNYYYLTDLINNIIIDNFISTLMITVGKC